MHIPKQWFLARATGRLPDGREVPIKTWGWGDDPRSAEAEAGTRLRRVLDRLARGESFPGTYPEYASRPLREEILAVFGERAGAEPSAILTRNAYGAQILNVANLLFLDIDVAPATGWQQLLVGLRLQRDSRHADGLAKLRQALQGYGRATFRIYRTAAGFRVLAIDRQFDPDGPDTRQLMAATDTDPDYRRLCAAQRSFRARLTPKPWRCGSERMHPRYPRSDDNQTRFQTWLEQYESACGSFSTCEYLETVGSGRPIEAFEELLELHDRITRSAETLPLA